MKTQIEAMARVLDREIKMRKAVYGRKVADGTMSPDTADKGIKAMEDIAEYVSRSAEVIAEFGKFAEALFNGRRGVPKDGDWFSLDSGEKSEAAITIEGLKNAKSILSDFGQKMPPPPVQTSLF